MASSTVAGQFPTFQDGDVTIVVSTSKIYKLHSHVLRRVSPYFEHHLNPESAPKLNASARREGRTPWRFMLLNDRAVTGYGAFIPLKVTESGRVQDYESPPRGMHSGMGDDKDRCWDWLFGCFYNIRPNFDSSTFGATVSDCFILVDVASTISAVDHVREMVDLALMRQDEVLWKSIAANPCAWAELGARLRSPTIFKEAIIHVVGRWKMLSSDERDTLHENIATLCEQKHQDLELAKRAIEIRIAGHYPAFLCRNHADKPHRTAYAQDIYTWMGLCYFRHYISQSGNDARNRLADDGGYAWYRALATGGSAYLNHEDMKDFHQYFPMSSKACGVLEAHMNVLKDEIKVFVKDLMKVRTHVNPALLENVTKPWLTCIVVNDEDLPWFAPPLPEMDEINHLRGLVDEPEMVAGPGDDPEADAEGETDNEIDVA